MSAPPSTVEAPPAPPGSSKVTKGIFLAAAALGVTAGILAPFRPMLAGILAGVGVGVGFLGGYYHSLFDHP